MKKFGVIFAVLFLGGCATLEDFRAMTPPERADYVCQRHWEAGQIRAELDNAESFAADSEIALSRGYRLHRSCELIPVVVGATERCITEEDGARVCRETSELSRKEVCKDEPVAIDGAFEKEKLNGYRKQIRQLRAEHDAAFNACVAKVRGMSAADAFDYFQSVKGGF